MAKKKATQVKSEVLVWAFQPLKELDKATGFVTCDEDLATKLLADGKVQDPRIGAHSLKPIQDKPTPAPRKQKEAPKTTKAK